MQPASRARAGFALTVGQRVEVGYTPGPLDEPTDLDSARIAWVPSRVEDIRLEDGAVIIAWPTDAERRLIEAAVGQQVEVAASNARDALYAARARVHSLARGSLPMVELMPEEAWRRTQRRRAFRVQVAIRPRIANKVMGPAFKAMRLGITDLSAAGVQVRSQDPLRPGDVLSLAFPLGDFPDELMVQARVQRVSRLERGRDGHVVWDAGCAFDSLAERLEQRIVHYIFAQQRLTARARGERA